MALKPNNVESLHLIISNIQNCVIDVKSRAPIQYKDVVLPV